MASITRIHATDVCGVIGVTLNTMAPATAPAVMVSIVIRDPSRAMTMPPEMAPATPPRLKAVRLVLAAAEPSPPAARMDGSQLNPRYTASRHEKNAIHSA